MRIVLTEIERPAVVTCHGCRDKIDLRDGGVYPHALVGAKLYPVCVHCCTRHAVELATCVAGYGYAQANFNRMFPHKARQVAIMRMLTRLGDAMVERAEANEVAAH